MLHARRLSMLGTLMGLAILGTAGSARADFFTVSPGGRVCLAPPTSASNHIEAWGTAPNGARFTVNASTDGVNFTQIYQTTDGSAGFHATFDKADPLYSPWFPGSFKLCVRNTAASPQTVNIYFTNVY